MAKKRIPEVLIENCIVDFGEGLYCAYMWAELVARRVRFVSLGDIDYLVNETAKAPAADTVVGIKILAGDAMQVRFRNRQVVEVEMGLTVHDGQARNLPTRIAYTDYELLCDDKGLTVDTRNMMLGLHTYCFEGNKLRTLVATLLPFASWQPESLALPATSQG